MKTTLNFQVRAGFKLAPYCLLALLLLLAFSGCKEDEEQRSAECELILFTVNGIPWNIAGATITHTYPEGTTATTLTPVITVSTGATVTPASGVAQHFFTDAGVTYTVTAADGTTKKTYVAKAQIQEQSVVASGTTGACSWTLTGTANSYTLTISGNGAMAGYFYTSDVPWYSFGQALKP